MAKIYQFPDREHRQVVKKTLKVAKRKILFKKIASLMGKFFFWLFIWSRRITANVLHMSVYFGLSLLHFFCYLLFVLGGFYCLIHYTLATWYNGANIARFSRSRAI